MPVTQISPALTAPPDFAAFGQSLRQLFDPKGVEREEQQEFFKAHPEMAQFVARAMRSAPTPEEGAKSFGDAFGFDTDLLMDFPTLFPAGVEEQFEVALTGTPDGVAQMVRTQLEGLGASEMASRFARMVSQAKVDGHDELIPLIMEAYTSTLTAEAAGGRAATEEADFNAQRFAALISQGNADLMAVAAKRELELKTQMDEGTLGLHEKFIDFASTLGPEQTGRLTASLFAPGYLQDLQRSEQGERDIASLYASLAADIETGAKVDLFKAFQLQLDATDAASTLLVDIKELTRRKDRVELSGKLALFDRLLEGYDQISGALGLPVSPTFRVVAEDRSWGRARIVLVDPPSSENMTEEQVTKLGQAYDALANGSLVPEQLLVSDLYLSLPQADKELVDTHLADMDPDAQRRAVEGEVPPLSVGELLTDPDRPISSLSEGEMLAKVGKELHPDTGQMWSTTDVINERQRRRKEGFEAFESGVSTTRGIIGGYAATIANILSLDIKPPEK